MISLGQLRSSEKLRFLLVSLFAGLWGAQFIFSDIPFLLAGTVFLFLTGIWKQFLFGVLAAFFLSLGYAQYRVSLSQPSITPIREESQFFQGMVVSFPDIRQENNRVFLKLKSTGEKVLFIYDSPVSLRYGDIIQGKGDFSLPRNTNDFDYRAYLARYGTFRLIRFPETFRVIDRGEGSFLLRAAQKVRSWFSHNIQKTLPAPHRSIGVGILLGIKHELPDAVQEDFRRSGLQHLLVVSGFNVTIVIILVAFLLRRFGRRMVFLGSAMALLFFVAMTGVEPPILRAAFMGILVSWASVLGRFSDARNIILLSFVLLGLQNPLLVQKDVSFFLSSFATVGIVLGAPVLEKYLFFVPDRYEFRTLLSVTLAAQIAVFPILGFSFGSFPGAGLLANIFAEPLVPLGMFFSFLSGIFGFLPQIPAEILSVPAFVLLEVLLHLAHLFGKIPPLEFPVWVYQGSLFLLLLFFLWGFFSRRFFQLFLRSSRILDFAGEKNNNLSA